MQSDHYYRLSTRSVSALDRAGYARPMEKLFEPRITDTFDEAKAMTFEDDLRLRMHRQVCAQPACTSRSDHTISIRFEIYAAITALDGGKFSVHLAASIF